VILVIVLGPWIIVLITSIKRHRYIQEQEQSRDKELKAIPDQYREDVSGIKKLYENSETLRSVRWFSNIRLPGFIRRRLFKI
jgi:hypothetical protein